jgi:hypothetical protein
LNTRPHHHASIVARITIIVAASLTAASANESHASFAVTATVLAVASIEQQSLPNELNISAADLRRGFIDVPQPVALTIRSNSPEGFSLDLMTIAPIVSSMVVHGFDDELSLGAEGGTIVQRWRGAQVVNLSLRFTLVLAPNLTVGHYPWPVRMAVRPLEHT